MVICNTRHTSHNNQPIYLVHSWYLPNVKLDGKAKTQRVELSSLVPGERNLYRSKSKEIIKKI